MQDFMLHKGIITDSLGKEDLQEFVSGASNWENREEDIDKEIRKIAKQKKRNSLT